MLASALVEIHTSWSWVVIIGNALAGAWALSAHFAKALRTRALWWYTGAAQLAMFIQVALGVALMTAEDRQAPEFHLFYGFVAILAIGIIYSYKFALKHRLYLLYGFGGLFIAGLGIRAMIVGQA